MKYILIAQLEGHINSFTAAGWVRLPNWCEVKNPGAVLMTLAEAQKRRTEVLANALNSKTVEVIILPVAA